MTPHSAFVTSAAPARLSGLSRACGGIGSDNARRLPSLSRARTAVSGIRSARMVSGRKFFVGGNWKCNLNSTKITALVEALNAGPPLDGGLVDVVVAPPSVYIASTRGQLRRDFAVGGQNAWLGPGGAFTGEVEASMLRDVGADWVILGHSERRHINEIRESDATIAAKAKYALEEGLSVIYCIGELLEEREAGRTLEVCQRQLSALAGCIDDWSNVVLAYEPVWAIGTGKVATPEQAEEVHLDVREWLAKNVSKKVADATRILYGGSVSPKNCVELAKLPDIDGFLVGGASLTEGFLEVVDSYKAALASAV